MKRPQDLFLFTVKGRGRRSGPITALTFVLASDFYIFLSSVHYTEDRKETSLLRFFVEIVLFFPPGDLRLIYYYFLELIVHKMANLFPLKLAQSSEAKQTICFLAINKRKHNVLHFLLHNRDGYLLLGAAFMLSSCEPPCGLQDPAVTPLCFLEVQEAPARWVFFLSRGPVFSTVLTTG